MSLRRSERTATIVWGVYIPKPNSILRRCREKGRFTTAGGGKKVKREEVRWLAVVA